MRSGQGVQPPRNARKLYDFMVEKARLRDHIYFCADSTAAEALGVTRMTIYRWRCQLEKGGWIERTKNPCPWFRTVAYRFPRRRVTQRTSCRRARTSRASSCVGVSRRRGRRRRLIMEGSTDIVRADGSITPFGAGDAVAAVADEFRERGVPLAPSIRARLGKAAKALLDSGFPTEVVVAAMVMAVKTRMFGSVESIAQEMAMAQVGEVVSREEYRQELQKASDRIRNSDNAVYQHFESRRRQAVEGHDTG